MNRAITAAALAALIAPAGARAQQAAGYFQQGVDYRIEARLDEPGNVLHGRARLRYTNRGPRGLDTIYVHQHLNAFRPNSAWARREAGYGETRFQKLGPEDHAYERFTAVRVDGRTVRAAYPIAPDSTVAAIPLGARLAPGASVTLDMDWDARLSTTPRRQGRAGRHYDWAQWYPRVAVYDRGGWEAHPLLPQGEFYGEYATYDVTLDVPADQVIGATGVAVEGDPGYTVTPFEKGFYRPAAAVQLGLLGGAAEGGRKRVRFHAENVHHFAWSADPRYRAEGVTRLVMSDAEPAPRGLPAIHALFLPEDTSWSGGKAARYTYDALAWLQAKLSPYPWPQLTNVHRIEGGGTEFPMMVMNGSAGPGLIVHETAHQWVHGILGNNEWKEGWLDEGFASFLTNWYYEDHATVAHNDSGGVWRGTMASLERAEAAGPLPSISLRSEDFADPQVYGMMTYTKPSAVLRMLREYLGRETMERVLHEYARRYQFKHVTGDDFRRTAEQVSGQPLGWFWDQWIRRSDRLDYSIASATTRQTGGRWNTVIEVRRAGEAWMPVELRVGGATRTLTGRGRSQRIIVTSSTRPAEAMLDPRWILIDYDRANNRASIR